MYQCITERKARGYMCPRIDAEIHCRIPEYQLLSSQYKRWNATPTVYMINRQSFSFEACYHYINNMILALIDFA